MHDNKIFRGNNQKAKILLNKEMIWEATKVKFKGAIHQQARQELKHWKLYFGMKNGRRTHKSRIDTVRMFQVLKTHPQTIKNFPVFKWKMIIRHLNTILSNSIIILKIICLSQVRSKSIKSIYKNKMRMRNVLKKIKRHLNRINKIIKI